MTENLRSLLELVAKKCPEDLVEINEATDPAHHEVAAYLRLMEDRGRLPVTMFRQVKDLNGELSQFPLVHNVFATRPHLAMAVGMDPSKYGVELIARLVEMQGKPVDYEVITPAEAPVLENVWRGGEADIYRLPTARYHEKDAGYIRLIVIGLKLTVNRERAADLPLLSRLGRHLRKMSRLII